LSGGRIDAVASERLVSWLQLLAVRIKTDSQRASLARLDHFRKYTFTILARVTRQAYRATNNGPGSNKAAPPGWPGGPDGTGGPDSYYADLGPAPGIDPNTTWEQLELQQRSTAKKLGWDEGSWTEYTPPEAYRLPWKELGEETQLLAQTLGCSPQQWDSDHAHWLDRRDTEEVGRQLYPLVAGAVYNGAHPAKAIQTLLAS
jgi:hypothetical protein